MNMHMSYVDDPHNAHVTLTSHMKNLLCKQSPIFELPGYSFSTYIYQKAAQHQGPRPKS